MHLATVPWYHQLRKVKEMWKVCRRAENPASSRSLYHVHSFRFRIASLVNFTLHLLVSPLTLDAD